MIKNLKSVLKIIPFKTKYKLISIAVLTSVGAFLDILSIGALIPLLNFIENKEFINEMIDYAPIGKNFIQNLDGNETIITLCIFFLFIFFLKTIFSIFVLKYQIGFVSRLKYELTTFFFKIYSLKNFNFFKQNSSNKILVDIDKSIIEFCNRFVFATLVIFSETLIISAYFIFFAIIGNYSFFYVSIYLLLIFVLFNFLTKNKITKASKVWQNLNVKKIKILQEYVRGVREIKTKRNGYFFINLFKNYSYNFEKSYASFNFLQLVNRPIIEFLLLSALITYFLFLLKIKNFDTAIFDFIIICVVAIRLAPSFSRIIYNFSNLKFSLPFAKKVFSELLNLKVNNIKKKSLKNIQQIEFCNIDFEYNNKKIFKNLNFLLEKNQHVCIVGPSGSGKSTFIELMLGLIKHNRGQILINKNINFDLDKQILPATYIPQEPIILDDSIKNNIIFGEGNFDEKNFLESVDISSINEWIKNLKDGINTVTGEFGGKISGGQKQRLAIARGIYSNKEIIIMDEPLSAVDHITKEKIFSKLFEKMKNKIVIVITHDKSNLKYFQHIYSLENYTLKKI